MKVLNSYEKRQGGYDVNDVINKLSDIEQASVGKKFQKNITVQYSARVDIT